MANETPQQIADQAAKAGFTGSGLSNIVAIVLAESSGNASATHVNNNGSTDYGLAQINSIHGVSQASMMDPSANLAEAYKLSNNGTNFSPWVTYNTGAYKQYLGQATGATSGIGQTTATPGSDAAGGAATGSDPAAGTAAGGTPQSSGGAATNGTLGATTNQGSGGGITVDLVPGLKDLVSELTKDTTAIGGAMSAIGTFLQKLLWFTYPSSWVRIFAGGLGAVLLFFGLHYLGKEIKA